MRINQNISAMNTYSRLTGANNAKSKSLEKLSSGLRINRAGDDAAGLAISEKMRGQIGGLNQAVRNAQDGISLIQTAEGALNETHSILNRMRELAVQSSSDTNTNDDRLEIQKEINELATEITRIADTTEFNTQNLLGGDFKAKFHIGANKGQNMSLEIGAMGANDLNVAGSGEGKANFEIAGANVTLDAAKLDDVGLVEGEQTLNVVEIDNVTTQSGVANYGLANDKGEIVATSKDGKTFELLKGAYKASDLSKATVSHADDKITFVDAVTSGEVTLKASDVGVISDIKATASVDVKGLESGEYSRKDITAANFSNYFGAGKIELAAATGLAQADITSVLLDKEGNVAAVEFANGTTNTANANKYFAAKDIDFKASNATAGDRIDAAIDKAEAALTTGTALTDGAKLEIKADGGIDVSSQEAADAAIEIIDKAVANVSAERSKLGATQNRLDHTINNLTATSENLSAAESRIRDVDMAQEMMEFTKNNILSQAATSMLAQANQMPQSVLQLLQ